MHHNNTNKNGTNKIIFNYIYYIVLIISEFLNCVTFS